MSGWHIRAAGPGLSAQPADQPSEDGAALLASRLAKPIGGEQPPPGSSAKTAPTPAPAKAPRIKATLTLRGWSLEAKFVKRTDKGVLFAITGKEVWFPRQHVYSTTPPVVSEWIANQRTNDLELIYTDDMLDALRRERDSVPRGRAWFPDVE